MLVAGQYAATEKNHDPERRVVTPVRHEHARLVLWIVENPMLNVETIRLDGAIRMGPR